MTTNQLKRTASELVYVVTPAERKGIKALVLLFGKSGSGKTKSALRLARGLVGPKGKIGFLDTEHRRGLHYANDHDYYWAGMDAPFSPSAYLKALEDFEAQGVDCMIVDSMSHVQEGEGGLIDMADAEEAKSNNRDARAKWAKPKAEWKRVRNRFLQSRMHIIFCARAKEPLIKDGNKVEKGPLTPIIPADFEYEVTLALGLDEETHAIIPVKLPHELAGAFPLDKFINEKAGEAMLAWLDGGRVVDHALEAQKEAGRSAARHGADALRQWWAGLTPALKMRLEDFKDTLKADAPAPAKRQPSGGGDPAKSARSGSPPPPPSWPVIELDMAPDWLKIAGQIADLMDANPDDAVQIELHYRDVLAKMEEASPQARDFVAGVAKTHIGE